MKKLVRVVALASMAAVAPAIVEAQAKPVVAVLYFDNSSFGSARAEYDGLGKGIAEILITDMASNPNMRVVERERVQALLTEQNLVKAGSIDPQTAIRLGKIIGAQYMITGTFMSDSKTSLLLTSRVINVETSQILPNTVKLQGKSDDVMGLISQLSTKLNTEMKLPALRVGEAPGSGGAVPAGQPAAPAAAPARTADATPAADKSVSKPAMQVAQAKTTRKMDMKTAMLYSKALEAEDAGNKSMAVDLYKQVNVKFPDYAPVQKKIAVLSRG